MTLLTAQIFCGHGAFDGFARQDSQPANWSAHLLLHDLLFLVDYGLRPVIVIQEYCRSD